MIALLIIETAQIDRRK